MPFHHAYWGVLGWSSGSTLDVTHGMDYGYLGEPFVVWTNVGDDDTAYNSMDYGYLGEPVTTWSNV